MPTSEQRVLLVNYSGYWLTANTFIPDTSLATLAGALQAQKIPVEIVDLQSPSEVGKVMAYGGQAAAKQVVDILRAGERPSDALLQTYLEARRKGQELLECEIMAGLIAKIRDENVTVVGFKLWAGNGLRGALRVAEAIKQTFPHVRLIAGGPVIQLGREFVLTKTRAFDSLVYGDGEQAIVDLVLRGNAASLNTIHSNHVSGARVCPTYLDNLDTLARPNYSPEVYPSCAGHFKLRLIDDSRGCFNRCSFCHHPGLSGTKVRTKSPTRVVDEIEWHINHENVNTFRFSGSNPPAKFLMRVAEEITRRRLSIQYSVFSSFNNTRSLDFELLRRSGLCAMQFGLESGDPAYLRRVHNKSNGSQEYVVATARKAMAHGIFVGLSTIVPSPFETDATKNATLSVLRDIFRDTQHGSVAVFPPTLAPGSQWWSRMDDFGFEFAPGVDEQQFLSELLVVDFNFLLPRDCMKPFGLILNGKPYEVILSECQSFVTEVASLGVTTDVDDSVYMLSLMAGIPVGEFKQAMLENLILGHPKNLTDLVARFTPTHAA